MIVSNFKIAVVMMIIRKKLSKEVGFAYLGIHFSSPSLFAFSLVN